MAMDLIATAKNRINLSINRKVERSDIETHAKILVMSRPNNNCLDRKSVKQDV